MAFENPQQLGLAFERQLADFVEKQRAQVGLLEEADVVAVGAGERAGLVAEELALHEVGRDRGAVDRDHRPIGPRAGAVDRPGDQLLAGAAFAAHQHAARRPGDAIDLRLQVAHRRALADQLVVAGRLLDQPLVVALQRRAARGPAPARSPRCWPPR